MNEIIERTRNKSPIWREIKRFRNRTHDWETVKTVCVVSGLSGCGKTTLLLEYFKSKGRKVFYFSLKGLDESTAERLLISRVVELTGETSVDWGTAFTAISKCYKNVIFDDIAALSTYKRFNQAFYENMIQKIYSRPFVVFIAQPNENIYGLADKYVKIKVDYFSVPDVIKCFPKLSKIDKLGICAISGGIPKIFAEYDVEISFEENVRKFFHPDSAFCGFTPKLLSKYFRRPESYHAILCAIANSNHKVSDIGKFTGFAYNKCDNYLSALIDLGFVSAEKEKMKSGAEKTVYHLKNNYFKLWYLYIYKNQIALRLGDESLIDSIVQNIINKEIHAFHLEKAFALANEKIHWKLWASFRITDKVYYAPQTVRKDKFSYTFDAIVRNGEKAVFIKVFEDSDNTCRPLELKRIRHAVSLVNKLYDSHIFIFSKRRFCDEATNEAAWDEGLTLVEMDRLKF